MLVELYNYGSLLQQDRGEKARESFCGGLIGSILYAHYQPRSISSSTRVMVSLLTDGLFLLITTRLLGAVACDYSGTSPVLMSNPAIQVRLFQ